MDFSDPPDRLLTLISVTGVFNLKSVRLFEWRKSTQSFIVIVYSPVNVDKRKKSRDWSEEERKKAIDKHAEIKATKPSPRSFMFL